MRTKLDELSVTIEVIPLGLWENLVELYQNILKNVQIFLNLVSGKIFKVFKRGLFSKYFCAIFGDSSA